MSIFAAGKVFLALCILLPAGAAAALHYAITGRLSLIPLSAFLLSYNYMLSWGFLNFVFAASLAVALFAGWIASAHWRRLPRLMVFSVLGLGLYLMHLFGFAAFGIAVAGYEAAQMVRRRFRPARSIVLDLLLLASLPLLPIAVFLATVDTGRAAAGALLTVAASWRQTLMAFRSPLFFVAPGLIETLTMAFVGTVAAWGLATRRLRLHPAVWPTALLTAAIAMLVPEWLLGVWAPNLRLPFVLMLLLASGVLIQAGPRAGAILLVGIVLVFSAKVIDASTAMRATASDMANVRRVLAALPIGSKLLVGEARQSEMPRKATPWRFTSQMGMLALIERQAFVPFLFTGVTVVHVRPEYQALSTPHGHPISLAELHEGLRRADEAHLTPDDGAGRRIYWLGWPDKFDYVLWSHFGASVEGLPANLELVAASDTANLYRIVRPG